MTRRRLFAFAIDPELAQGLKLVKERDGVSESEQARRAIKAWLTEKKALPKARSKAGGRGQR